jgi:hypothetical protein
MLVDGVPAKHPRRTLTLVGTLPFPRVLGVVLGLSCKFAAGSVRVTGGEDKMGKGKASRRLQAYPETDTGPPFDRGVECISLYSMYSPNPFPNQVPYSPGRKLTSRSPRCSKTSPTNPPTPKNNT